MRLVRHCREVVMSTIAYLTVVGAKQGAIKGDVTIHGREGTIALIGVSSQLNVPFDAATGAAQGRRQHHPITVTKLLDQATPKLYAALVTNENLTDFTVAFWGQLPDGKEIAQFTIKLTDARIVGIALAAHEAQGAAAAAPAPSQEVQLTYRRITWTWSQGNVTATDDWVAPTA
jgi:type VI secretion system secreted protein Hcp